MYGRKYSILAAEVAISAVQDLLEIIVPADACMVLHEIKFTQSTEEGDAQDEQLAFEIKRGVGSTSGSGGSVPTPQKLQTGDAAAGITAEANNTTQAVAGGGSLDTIYAEDANIRAGWHYLPPPEQRIIFSPGEEAYISLEEAPADALTGSIEAIVEEIGG